MWYAGWDAWENMNKILHDTLFATVLSGASLFDWSLWAQWTLCFNSFSSVVRAALPNDISTVMNDSVSNIQLCFVLVWRTRIERQMGLQTQNEARGSGLACRWTKNDIKAKMKTKREMQRCWRDLRDLKSPFSQYYE